MLTDTVLKQKLETKFPETLDPKEITEIIENSISSSNIMIKEMYLPKFLESFTIQNRLNLFNTLIDTCKSTSQDIKFLNHMFEKSLSESISCYPLQVIEIVDELSQLGLKFKLDLMIDIIWKCQKNQDQNKKIDLKTSRFVDQYIHDLSIHQINELVNKNLNLGYFDIAREIVEKQTVKDQRFNLVFKEWATFLVQKYMHKGPWLLLKNIFWSPDKNDSHSKRALQDYLKLLIVNQLEMSQFMEMVDSIFEFSCMDGHLLCLSYIVRNNEWMNFQGYLKNLHNKQMLNCRIFKVTINAQCHVRNYQQMKFVLSILLKNEDLFMELELSQNQYKFVVMCLFQIMQEKNASLEKQEDEDEKVEAATVQNFLTVFQENLEKKSAMSINDEFMIVEDFQCHLKITVN